MSEGCRLLRVWSGTKQAWMMRCESIEGNGVVVVSAISSLGDALAGAIYGTKPPVQSGSAVVE